MGIARIARERDYIILSLVLLAWLILTASPVRAQEQNPAWTLPRLLGHFAIYPSNPSPAIVADQAGWVHVFWVNRIEDTGTSLIMYTRWDGTSWSTPVDVLMSPETGNEAHNPRAVVGQDGRLHVLWEGRVGDVYHSSALATTAASARSWTQPRTIPTRFPATGAFLATDERDRLHVTYLDKETQSPRYLRSDDGGETWSEGSDISEYDAVPILAEPCSSYIALDGRGRIHVAWRRGATQLVHYARSTDDGQTWTRPHSIPGPSGSEVVYQISPSLATVGEDTIHLSWLAAYERKPQGGLIALLRYHQMSTDGGRTWTPPAQILQDIAGHNGPNTMVVDSAGTVHMVTVGGGGPGAIHYVFYTHWTAGGWSPYVGLPGSRRDDWDLEGPSASHVAIGRGNQLHVVWETRDGDIWYATATVDAPSLPAQQIPTPQALPTVTPFPTETSPPPLETATPTPSPAAPVAATGIAQSKWWLPLAAGFLPVAGLVSLILVVRRLRRTTRPGAAR